MRWRAVTANKYSLSLLFHFNSRHHVYSSHVTHYQQVAEKIATKTEEAKKLTEQWEAERDRVEQRNKLREQLDAARIELERAKRRSDFELYVAEKILRNGSVFSSVPHIEHSAIMPNNLRDFKDLVSLFDQLTQCGCSVVRKMTLHSCLARPSCDLSQSK